jgi:hypothetical protein
MNRAPVPRRFAAWPRDNLDIHTGEHSGSPPFGHRITTAAGWPDINIITSSHHHHHHHHIFSLIKASVFGLLPLHVVDGGAAPRRRHDWGRELEPSAGLTRMP